MVVVLPAPFGPRKPNASPSVISRSTSMMPRWAPYVLVRRSVRMTGSMSVLPAGRAGVLAEESIHDERDLALHEGEHVAEFLEAGLAGRRPVLDGEEAALGDLPEVPVDAPR